MSKMSSTSNSLSISRGACMECRRLKTKCDRAVPCAPCIRRGCESICPSGLRARGSRNPGAEVETLNRNIQSMTARIRQLEEALQMAHAHSSGSGSPTSPPGIYGSLVDQSAPEFNSIAARAHTDKNTEIALRQQILNMIPNENAARILLDQFYLTHGWVVQPISQHHLYNILFKRAYSIPCTASNSELSALCSVFSLATAGEALTNPDSWVTSTQFHEMSMAALRLNDVLADSNVATIEAMALQCCYLYLGSETDQIQRSWNYLGITLRIAHSIGLHRDPGLLNLDDEECNRRRRLFHELVALETWMCMIIERPPSLHSTFFSTEMPYDTPETLGNDPTFFRWKHDFAREGVLPIVNEVTCATIPPTYSTVLRIDKLCRGCTFPTKLQFVDFNTAPIEVLLQSQQLFLMRETALMRLHKVEFLRALKEYPDDPFKSHAAYSIQTIIDSASSLLKRLRTISTDCSRLLPRLSCPWEAAISSLSYLAVFLRTYSNEAVVGSVYIEFEMGCKLVMDHSEDTTRIKRLVPHTLELRRGVHEAAPHLTDSLRRALSERRQSDASMNNGLSVSLEYPLGPAPAAPQRASVFPFGIVEDDILPGAIDMGITRDAFNNTPPIFNYRPPPSDPQALFDGTIPPMMASGIRFEVPSSNLLGDETSMFALDGGGDPKSANSQQAYIGGHFGSF